MNPSGGGEGPLGVALVGYGYWGPNLARNLRAAAGAELVAVADADEDRRARARATFPEISIWSSLDEVLDDPAVEAVALATPAAGHARQAHQALASGRDVLVEKPLALDPDEAEELAEAADDLGRTLAVGHTFLYAPAVRELKRYIDEGALGHVHYLYSQRLNLGRIRQDCDVLWNLAPHDVAIMLYLLGQTPKWVSATGLSFLQPGIDDVSFASLRFPSGIGGNIHVSWIDPRKVRLMTVVGDRKMAVYDDVSADQKIWLFDAGAERDVVAGFGEFGTLGEFQWKTRAGDIVIPKLELREPLLVEVEEFAACCRSKQRPVADGWHGARVVRTLAAITRSAQGGGHRVELDEDER